MLVDTSVLLASINSRDPAHVPCAALLVNEEWVLPEPVIVELDHMLRARNVNRAAFAGLASSIEAGAISLEALIPSDFLRVHELYVQYSQVDFVDIAIVALAERLKETTIATLDHRDFRIIRPNHIPAFTLVP
jgi:predicted nucleic acid-binding protein